MDRMLPMPGARIEGWAQQGLAMLRRWWRARPPRQLRLRETLALGERRFVAVVEFEQQRFLIGGSQSSMTLLARIPPGEARLTQKGGDSGAVQSLEAAGEYGEDEE